ncbi:MAG: 2-amino-4-hydroxy-6-hydroxymethyldihydropteridine diphosphokinase [Phycisphaerae bacterium]|nr:2-amino-4-hydroxy-6-hydroxymethyldihydropteridine diphosphokinase [Phycisphaerae bacterium]
MMSKETVAYIGLGSNLGDRKGFLDQAVALIGQTPDTEVCQVSAYEGSEPLAGTDQPEYLNGVVQVQTTLSAQALFAYLRRIEDCLGRERSTRWASRTLDLDLLLYGDAVIRDPDLTVPHPAMHLRSFVLKPLAAMSPNLMHPVLKVSMATLSQRIKQGSFVLEPDMPQLISIAGNIGVGKTTLADRLAQALHAEVLYEPYDQNPFMPEVYAGNAAYALDSQLFFLVNRAQQVGRDTLVSGQVYVSDYLFDKEWIYACALLDERQLALYRKIYTPFAENVTPPRLVLYLHDSSTRCLERIHRRNRVYEQGIKEPFLDGLDQAYESLLNTWDRSPVIRLDVTRFDSLDSVHLARLADELQHYIEVHHADH